MLAETVPTTLQGLFAMLAYNPVAMKQQGDDDGFDPLFGGNKTIFISMAKEGRSCFSPGKAHAVLSREEPVLDRDVVQSLAI